MSSISATSPSGGVTYDRILSGQTITVPIYTQYIVSQELILEGDIVVVGTLVIFNG